MRQKSWRDAEGPELGPAIRRIRTDQGMSRKELAKRTGISYAYLTEIELGKRTPSDRLKAPSQSALNAIAEALGVRPHEFHVVAEDLSSLPPSAPEPPSDEPVMFERQSLHFHRAREVEPALSSPVSDSRRVDLQLMLDRLARSLNDEDLERVVDLARRFAGYQGPRRR